MSREAVLETVARARRAFTEGRCVPAGGDFYRSRPEGPPACCLVGAAFFEELSDADYDSYVRKAKDLGLTPYERIALQAGWDGAVDGVDEHVGERTLWVVALNQAEAYQQGRALYEEVKRVA